MDPAKLQHVRTLVALIGDGATSNDQRQRAEASLLQLINTETSSVFFCLTNIYTDKDNPRDLRAAAGTTLGFALTGKSDKDEPYWLRLEADLVDYIKDHCLIIPFQDDPALTQVGCKINATIYAIEIGGRGWKALLSRIVQAMEYKAADHERYHYAAINTLSNICDLVNTKSLPIPEEERANLIATIFLAIGPEERNEEVKIAGFKALAMSINFYTNLFRDEAARTYLFTQIVSSMDVRSSDVVRAAYEALIETIRPLYGYLDQYLTKIIDRCRELLQNPSRGGNLGIIATEFFSTLATEDLNYLRASQEQVDFNFSPKHYVKEHFKNFLPQIMMNLRIEENNDGQVQNSLFSVSVQTLIACNEALGDESISLTQDFIGAMDRESSPLNTVAALAAFRCLIKSISKPQSHSLLSHSYHQILNHLDNQDFRIRFAAVEMIQTIAECCPAIMMSPDNSSKYFNNFFTFMEQSNDYPISIGLCRTFKTLISNTGNDNQNWLQIWMDFAERISALTLTQAFVGARGGPLDSQVIGVNLELLVFLIQKVYTAEMILNSMDKFIEAVNQAYKHSPDRKESLLEGILVCIGIAIHKSRREKGRFPPEFYIEIYKQLFHGCSQNNYVHREAIYVIGVIATHLSLKMAVYNREVFGLLKEALASTNEQYINCAFEVFGMMSRDHCEMLDNATVEELVMPFIMNRLSDTGCTIESKMICFITLGELALHHIQVLVKWIRDIFEKFKQGFEAAHQMLCEKVISYKLIESHLCIIHALYEENRMNQELNSIIELDFRVIARFVEGSCHPDLGCTMDHVVQCLGLITDTVVLNPPSLKAALHREFPTIVEIARRLRQRGTKTELQEVTLKFFENHTSITG